MHGVIPPEPGQGQGKLLAALAESWPRYGDAVVAGRGRVAGKRAQPIPRPLLATGQCALDALSIGVPGLLARDMIGQGEVPQGAVLLFGIGLALLGLAVAGGYRHAALFGGRRPLLASAGALVAALAALTVAAWLLGAPAALPMPVAGTWLGFALPLLLAGRIASARLVRAEAPRTALRAVVVGEGPQAARLAALANGRQPGPVRLLGVVDDRRRLPDATHGDSGLPHLGPFEVLQALIRRGEVDQVILALPWSAEARVAALVRRLSDYPVEVCLAPDLCTYRVPQAGPSLKLLHRPLDGWRGLAKRAEDVLLALGALAVAAVPMLLIALAVRLDSPGPVLFRQRRTGFNNRDFYVLKFRTMFTDQTDHEARVQVSEGDPRVTPVGAILRRASLDELPQLLNVLRGEMSFVGPRPHAPGTRAAGRPFEEVAERYAARHRVKPGLTGLAQVRGWRGPTETEEKLLRRVEADLEYIETWSLWLDALIILRTLVAVARMRNAY
jgi:Undecaprenyl-phosphate glucose phosphotransferase